MSFTALYEEVQAQHGRISTRWLKERAIALSHITHVKEQRSSILDAANLRGFYIEGPLGPPVPLGENQALIVIARSVCEGPLGDAYRRFIYTKELMHVFDEEHEKAGSPEAFDQQVTKFGNPKAEMTPQYRAEIKAVIRAWAVLCPREQREAYRAQLEAEEISLEVLAAALRVPPFVARDMMAPNLQKLIDDAM